MAPEAHVGLSFDDILQRDRESRQRKEAQELANDIFGRGRKEKAQQNGFRKNGPGPSLASRVGITKISQRSLSNPSRLRKPLESPKAEVVARPEERAPRSMRNPRQNPMSDRAKNDLLSEALIAKGATNQGRSRPSGPEISIRGAAGPYVVVASNFAPGTTAADIESAMVPSGSEVTSCRIVTAAPTVMAEIVFLEKRSAEQVIEMFNNKKADGRLLNVYMKTGGPTPIANPPATRHMPEAAKPTAVDLTRNEPPLSSDILSNPSDRSRRKAEPQVQDGRYGFTEKEDEMEVDGEASATPTQPAQRSYERQDDRRQSYDDRFGRNEQRYPAAPRDFNRGGGSGYYDRGGWGDNRARNAPRQYSSSQYERYPRGYR